jgi:hypothetical protein
MLGRRLNEHRNTFVVPPGTKWPNIAPDIDLNNPEGLDENALAQRPYSETAGEVNSFHLVDELLTVESGMDWDETISYVRQNCGLELWVKGSK